MRFILFAVQYKMLILTLLCVLRKADANEYIKPLNPRCVH